MDEVESSVTSLTTRTTELEGKSGKVLDADTGELVTLHSDVAGYTSYPNIVNVPNSNVWLSINDTSNYIYVFYGYSSGYSIYRGLWNKNGVTNATAMVVSQTNTNNFAYTRPGATVSVDNSVFTYQSSGARIYYDMNKNLEFVNTYGVESAVMKDYKVAIVNDSGGSTFYYSPRNASTSYNNISLGRNSSGSVIYCGVFSNTLYALIPNGTNYNNNITFTSYKIDVNSSASASYSNGWAPFASYACNVKLSLFDSEKIYMLLYTSTAMQSGTSTSYPETFANKFLIYDTKTGISNYSNITINSSPIYDNTTYVSIGYVESEGFFYILIRNNSDDTQASLMRCNISNGEYQIKTVRNIPNTMRPMYLSNNYKYLRTIKSTAISSDGSFLVDGYRINWSKATITLAVGVEQNNFGVISDNTYSPNFLYPFVKLRFNRVSTNSYGPSVIHHFGPVASSTALGVEYINDTQFKIIGAKEARIYRNDWS